VNGSAGGFPADGELLPLPLLTPLPRRGSVPNFSAGCDSVNSTATDDPQIKTVAELPPLSDSLVMASQPFVGRWNRLVSTTNWEKGWIIGQWREALVAQGLPTSEYSDEAWSRLVGGVSGQHVGRLRRVHQRFGQAREQYPDLYWSHFQAALDWDDAEMWLEGAKSSDWSVAQMRVTRWEALGKLEKDRPRPEDVVTSETDEDVEPSRGRGSSSPTSGGDREDNGPRHDGPDFGDESASRTGSQDSTFTAGDAIVGMTQPVEFVRPFEDLPELPDDLADAFDGMKLAILRHKTDGWQEISAADVLRTLDALKALVAAPSDSAPF
jgi:hypothetical protein